MIKLQVQCSNNNDSVKQFLSHDRKNGATPLLSLNCLFHEMVSEKLSEAHSLGFLVRWLEGSWPEQQHQWTSDTAPSSHQWGSPHSWQPESIITQCISRPLPKQWKKITFSSFFFFMQFLKKKNSISSGVNTTPVQQSCVGSCSAPMDKEQRRSGRWPSSPDLCYKVKESVQQQNNATTSVFGLGRRKTKILNKKSPVSLQRRIMYSKKH